MNIDHLKIFTNLAQTLNFSLTAKTMNISQSAVSQAIKSIENELGFTLFNRTKRQVSLTRSGAAFEQRIEAVLANFDKAVIDSREIYQRERSSLTIGTTGTTFEAHLLPLIIRNFCDTDDQIKLYLETFNHNQLKQHLLNQECDLIFTTQDDVADTPQIHFTPLVTGYFCALIPQSNPLSAAQQLDLYNLDQQNLIMLTNDWCPPLQLQMQDQLKKACPDADLTYADNVTTATTMVAAGLGSCVMPNFITCASQASFKIVPLNVTTPLAYGIATLADHPAPIALKFIKQVQRYDSLQQKN
ncbi:transcriptional regulator [Lactiplantibacillus fabifermentans T30PCM01]|uniref:Transcriptional regulator n=1 Tax=Lactiplantibacillus fabifermentans T30PCM01 TaxID=1400520 RepID=W6T9L0_9LACO|nr:LysR family transcriptional regulator [Lactiplantibacillus fabifermentans]ETY74563.1 transcriptional regulator [Lactiplantibacillus fabifermentans T30PCM01]